MNPQKHIVSRLGGALSLAVAGLLAISANAAPLAGGTVIGVDFGQTDPNNGAGNIFNGAAHNIGDIKGSYPATGTEAPLVDLNGIVVDGVSLTWAGAEFNGGFAADSTDLPGQPAIYNDSNLTDALLTKQGNTITLTFSNLNSSLTYNLNIGGGPRQPAMMRTRFIKLTGRILRANMMTGHWPGVISMGSPPMVQVCWSSRWKMLPGNQRILPWYRL